MIINRNNINPLLIKHKLQSVFVTLFILCIIFYPSKQVNAQNYSIRGGYDKGFYASNIAFSVVNLALTNKLNSTPHVWKVPAIDQFAQSKLNPSFVKISDASAVGTIALGGAMSFLLPKNQSVPYINCFAQNIWLTANLTQLVKISIQRSRPYTQGSGYLGTKDDNYSFFSGHSAITATAASTAIMFALQSNNNYVKSMAYGTGILALGTASLRIAAGKHYPSDVLTGLIIGTLVGILNTKMHKS